MKNRSIVLMSLLLLSTALFGQNATYVKPNIYAVIVGIGDYKDSNIPDLKFPEKDAAAFYNFLRSPNSGSVPEENIALLTGSKATRSNVYKEIVDKFSRSNKEDMIIFYFSGHGKAGYDENGYLLPYDSDFDNEAGTAVSMPEVKGRIESFQAKMKVSYVDACHAGLFASVGKGSMEDDNAVIAKAFLDILAKSSTASVRFLASSARQQSLEDEQIGHGVFTHFLLKGLGGEADLSQYGMSNYNDGLVSISELNTYLSASIPKHTKYKQIPSIEGQYNDEFPLSVLRANVSLATAISKVGGSAQKTIEKENYIQEPPTSPANKRAQVVDKECEKNNTGDYCFTNSTDKSLAVTLYIEKENTGYSIFVDRFNLVSISWSKEVIIQPGQAGCFYNIAATSMSYLIKEPGSFNASRVNLRGNINVEQCKSTAYVIK